MAFIKTLILLFALVAMTIASEVKNREKKQVYYGAYPAVTAYSGAAYPYAYSAYNAYAGYPYSAAYSVATPVAAVAAPAYYF